MSKFQSDNYNNANRGNYEIDKRNASCFVFEDGSWGGDFDRNSRKTDTTLTATGKIRGKKPSNKTEEKEPIKKKKQKDISGGITNYVRSTTKDSFEATENFSTYLHDFKNIINSSCKYADILHKYSPWHTKVQRKEKLPVQGSVFIYSSLKSGSGAFILGICLEHYGFSRYMDTSSAFNREDGQIKIEKAFRYAMITGETPNSRRSAILSLFNSWNNRHGEYIKILIGNNKGVLNNKHFLIFNI